MGIFERNETEGHGGQTRRGFGNTVAFTGALGLINRGLSALSQGLLKSEGRCTEHESVGPVVITT